MCIACVGYSYGNSRSWVDIETSSICVPSGFVKSVCNASNLLCHFAKVYAQVHVHAHARGLGHRLWSVPVADQDKWKPHFEKLLDVPRTIMLSPTC